jgi:leader peptidase (prepilin peptidase)/N-methyltransferase
MPIFIFIFIFILGTIIGSFLNVVIFRLNTGMTIATGRSICMICNRNLRWYELIPVFSFVIQSGKCRRCLSKISNQYPLIEIITGIIFVLIAYKFLPILYSYPIFYLWSFVVFAFIFSLLIVISVYDIRHKIIPDKLVYIFILISFLSIFVGHFSGGLFLKIPTIENLISGPVIALPFVLLWLLSRGRLMGLGDGKLMIGIGFLLGLSSGLFAVILSFWIGTIVSLPIMFLSRKKINMKTEIPFSPFLIASTLITFFFNFNMFSLVKLFSF